MTDTPYYFFASPSPEGQNALHVMTERYGQAADAASCKTIIALGGDGTVLRAAQLAIQHDKPVMGLNFGHEGFLANTYHEGEDLDARVAKATSFELHPLKADFTLLDGSVKTLFAINDAVICHRKFSEAIYMRVSADGGKAGWERIGGDGLIVCTTVGSTAYNRTAHGRVLPLGNDLINVTPICGYIPSPNGISILPESFPIRPKQLPITIEVLDPEHRVANATVDTEELDGVVKAEITLDSGHPYNLLFDPGDGLESRILRTQFSVPRPR